MKHIMLMNTAVLLTVLELVGGRIGEQEGREGCRLRRLKNGRVKVEAEVVFFKCNPGYKLDGPYKG